MSKLYRAARLLLGTIILVIMMDELYAQATLHPIVKKDLTSIPNSLKNILLLQPTAFEHDSNNFKTITTKTAKPYGFSAENMQAVFPSLVSTKHVSYMYGKNTYRSERVSIIDEAGLIPVMISAIQELHSEIETLKSELRDARKIAN